MKNISLNEFTANTNTIVTDVLSCGDIYCVDTGDMGSVVIMEEAEYKVLNDALASVFAVATSVNADEKTIDIATLLKKRAKSARIKKTKTKTVACDKPATVLILTINV